MTSDAVERVRDLKADEGKAIWLCGGAVLAGDLYAAGLIDEIIVKVNPLVFGEGIPLFPRSVEGSRLVLGEMHRFDSGHLIVEYRVAG